MPHIELEGLKEAQETLDAGIVRKAARRSINIVTKSGRTAASSQIRTIWNIKKAELDSRIDIVEATMNNMGAYINFSGKGIGTAYFDAVQFTGSTSRRLTKKGEKSTTRKRAYKFQGVRATVKIGQPKPLPGAFMVRLKSGHIGVFYRDSQRVMKSRSKWGNNKHSQAIVEKGVVSVATMFKQLRVYAAFLNQIYVQWQKVFPHELEQARGRASSD